MSNDALDWTATDKRAVDLIRVLAMDAVQKVGNGHPGTAMSLAPAAYLLYQRVLRHDPADPKWPGRDRFVLSCGHSSLTLYIQLVPVRLRSDPRRPEGAAHVGLDHPRPPRVRADPGRRDHHRPARPGHRQRGRHGDGRPPRARPVRPRRRARRVAVRPLRLRVRLRRRHGGGHHPRVLLDRRRAGARQPDRDLRRQPHLDRGRHHIAKDEDTAARYEAYGWHVQHVSWITADGATTRTCRRCTTRSRRPRPSPTSRRSSRCARSSAGPRRPSRTPGPRTAPRSATPRSPRPRRSSGSTRR